jgi:hypothetical protein
MTYTVKDANGEVFCENIATLEEVRQELITIFWYDAMGDDTEALENATLEDILTGAELILEETL